MSSIPLSVCGYDVYVKASGRLDAILASIDGITESSVVFFYMFQGSFNQYI